MHTIEEQNELNKGYEDSPFMPYTSLEYQRKKDGEIGYNQNQLLIPYVDGTRIISPSMIEYTSFIPDSFIRFVL